MNLTGLKEQISYIIGRDLARNFAQQGLDLVTRIFCDPGDVVLCEAPSYVGALGVFRAYQCEVAHVAMDDQGLDPVALREAVAALRSAGWCGSDPVCLETDPQQSGERVSGAACHCCLLLPETACERFNRELDRAMLVGDALQALAFEVLVGPLRSPLAFPPGMVPQAAVPAAAGGAG